MTGAAITVTELVPAMGLKLIYFTCTLDGSFDADFSAYQTVYYVKAVDDTSPYEVDEAVTIITQGGDVRFTDGTDIRGFAIVQE